MTRTMIALASAALLTVPAFALQQQQEGQQGGQAGAVQKKGQYGSRLAGTYRIVSGKSGGQEIPQDRLGVRVTIDDTMMTVYDSEDNEVYAVEFTFEGRRQGQGQGQPQAKGQGGMGRRIMLKTVRSSREDAVGSTARGRVRMEQGKLTLIYDYGEGGEYPEGFEPEGDSQHLFVLERVGDSGPGTGTGTEPATPRQP